MMIQVLIAALTTGLCTLFWGWTGLLGSLAGHVVFYLWIRPLL